MTEIGEIIRATFDYSMPNASTGQNVFHWILDEAPTTDAEVFTEVARWAEFDWGEDWQKLASNGAELESVKVDVVNIDGTIQRALGLAVIGLLGIEVSGVVSAAVSAYMLLKTIAPKVRGVKYVPGLADTVVIDGELTLDAFADLAFLLIEYATTLNPVGIAELVPGVPSSSLLVFQRFLDTGIIESIPAYQRRRKPNVGS